MIRIWCAEIINNTNRLECFKTEGPIYAILSHGREVNCAPEKKEKNKEVT
jgi:hypothetical protein